MNGAMRVRITPPGNGSLLWRIAWVENVEGGVLRVQRETDDPAEYQEQLSALIKENVERRAESYERRQRMNEQRLNLRKSKRSKLP